MEPQFSDICKKIFPDVIRSKIQELKMSLDLNEMNKDSNVILSPVSKLLKSFKLSEIFTLIYTVKNDSKTTRNVFACLSTKNISEQFTLPYLIHVADIVLTFNDKHNLTVTSKISGKNIITKQYVYNEDDKQSTSESSIVLRTGTTDTKVNPENIGTFKIGINEKDLVSRNALKLPYEKYVSYSFFFKQII